MENIRTRDSITKQFFSSWKEIFIDSEENNNALPTMSDLKAKDWELVSDADKKEILMNSPERIKAIVKVLLEKALPRRKRTAFASGTSVSKEQNVKKSERIQNISEEISDDFVK